MKRFMRYALTMGVLGCGLGSAAQSASADIVAAPNPPGGAFSGLVASGGGHTFSVTYPIGAGGGTVIYSCASTTYGNISGTGSSKDATFNPSFAGCTAWLGFSECKVRVDSPGTWTLHQGAAKTGGWGASLTIGADWTFTIDDADGCGIGPDDACPVTVSGGQTASGTTGFAANSLTTKVKLSGTLGGLTWSETSSAGCQADPSHTGSFTYSLNGTAGMQIGGIQLT